MYIFPCFFKVFSLFTMLESAKPLNDTQISKSIFIVPWLIQYCLAQVINQLMTSFLCCNQEAFLFPIL